MKPKTEKPRCAKQIVYYVGLGRYARPCKCSGLYEHEGKLWCRKHHPPTASETAKVRDGVWDAKWERERKARQKSEARAAILAELEAKAKAFHEMDQDGIALTGEGELFLSDAGRRLIELENAQ